MSIESVAASKYVPVARFGFTSKVVRHSPWSIIPRVPASQYHLTAVTFLHLFNVCVYSNQAYV